MNTSTQELKVTAKEIRRNIIKMIYEAGSGHPGGSLSSVEIIVALYFGIMEDADRFFLSNGHVCPTLYAVMAEKGLISKEKLSTYTELGSELQGHPERTRLKGIENTSGPLGLGLAQAAGYAAIVKNSFVYCETSDAEHDEGNHWEAVMFAAKYKLNNLIQIIDRNRIQIEGTVEEIMPLGNLIGRYKSFNWNVEEIDGHNFNEIFEAVDRAKNVQFLARM
jgi:transketolase